MSGTFTHTIPDIVEIITTTHPDIAEAITTTHPDRMGTITTTHPDIVEAITTTHPDRMGTATTTHLDMVTDLNLRIADLIRDEHIKKYSTTFFGFGRAFLTCPDDFSLPTPHTLPPTPYTPFF